MCQCKGHSFPYKIHNLYKTKCISIYQR
jgi:hypothetical protein